MSKYVYFWVAYQQCEKDLVLIASASIIGQVPIFQRPARDRAMERAFTILQPSFSGFQRDDWVRWCTVILTPVLSSLTPEMLENTTAYLNCTNYRIAWVARFWPNNLIALQQAMLSSCLVIMFLFLSGSMQGMAAVFSDIPLNARQPMADVLLRYLKKSASVINTPGKPDIWNGTVTIRELAQGIEIVTKCLEIVQSRKATCDLLHAQHENKCSTEYMYKWIRIPYVDVLAKL